MGLGLEFDTAIGENILKLRDGIKGAVPDGFVGELPEALSGLEFGGIGGLKDGEKVLGKAEGLAGVPGSIVELEKDGFGGADLEGFGEVAQDEFESTGGEFREDVPPSLPGLRSEKGIKVEPLVPVLHHSDGLLTLGCPDRPQHRMQADPMLVECPQLHGGPNGRRGNRKNQILKCSFHLLGQRFF